MIEPQAIPWAAIYAAPSAAAAVAQAEADPRTRREVVAGLRGLDRRFGRTILPAEHEPDIPPVEPPARAVFLLGATGVDSGVLGHVAAYHPRGAARASTAPSEAILGAAEVVDRVLETMAPLAPEAPRPLIEHVMPIEAAGDSHALAVGLVAVLATLSIDAAPAVAATGGWDPARGRFCPVSADTLKAKLAVAEAWGINRVLVIEGQEGLADVAMEVIELPADPGALPLGAIQHAAGDVGVASVRRALGLYDIQVARRHDTPIDAIFAATEPFVLERSCSDPVLRQIAADIRSRACLHRGRSAEASVWLDLALSLRGESYLPDGLTGDYLLYQQAAHHSIVRIDQGEIGDNPVHDRVDHLIDDLAGRWCTKHQSLCRMFLRHTRARRREYVGRLALDEAMLPAAIDDMLAEKEQWEALVEVYAQHTLRMGDTTLRRVHNQLIDLAVTEASLLDPAAFGMANGKALASPLADRLASYVWTAELDTMPSDASPYDVVGLLKWWWLRGNPLPAGVDSMVDPGRGFPNTLAAEFLVRLGSTAAREALRGSLEVASPQGSILRVLALRSASLCGAPLQDVAPPEEGSSLRRLFDDLRGSPATLAARCPY